MGVSVVGGMLLLLLIGCCQWGVSVVGGILLSE